MGHRLAQLLPTLAILCTFLLSGPAQAQDEDVNNQCYLTNCQQVMTGRHLTYKRALQIIQSEEYLADADLFSITSIYGTSPDSQHLLSNIIDLKRQGSTPPGPPGPPGPANEAQMLFTVAISAGLSAAGVLASHLFLNAQRAQRVTRAADTDVPEDLVDGDLRSIYYSLHSQHRLSNLIDAKRQGSTPPGPPGPAGATELMPTVIASIATSALTAAGMYFVTQLLPLNQRNRVGRSINTDKDLYSNDGTRLSNIMDLKRQGSTPPGPPGPPGPIDLNQAAAIAVITSTMAVGGLILLTRAFTPVARTRVARAAETALLGLANVSPAPDNVPQPGSLEGGALPEAVTELSAAALELVPPGLTPIAIFPHYVSPRSAPAISVIFQEAYQPASRLNTLPSPKLGKLARGSEGYAQPRYGFRTLVTLVNNASCLAGQCAPDPKLAGAITDLQRKFGKNQDHGPESSPTCTHELDKNQSCLRT